MLQIVCVFLMSLSLTMAAGTPVEPAETVLVRDGETCGGDTGKGCANPLSYCAVHNYSCGQGGQMGVCQNRPRICTTEDHPVCGCDGQTYPNFCKMAEAGMNAAHDGPCES
mgnify:CR=1 FL=1|tara:strand:- start:18413 stop:18745 length:333 start_codon:yes stop_codon:yes gene_type:complete